MFLILVIPYAHLDIFMIALSVAAEAVKNVRLQATGASFTKPEI